ncbi:uncharacterized protein LOC143294668 isoform X2 [Babylonia areolata]|uniref:uncharacterized protein LOC143294668 isoform X2 n=1 Tax=Babylonia areolata TaxID=304850 RepID=UPI003FD0A247
MSKKQKDQSKFEGNGVSYRAKIIGIEDVPEARGDEMCQEKMMKLKEQVKAGGQHKQRIFVNVTLEGLRIVDASTTNVLHTHPAHQISFISRDVTDSRAFGYIYSAGDGSHQFFGIKTANAAENLVLCLRDLFQTVYEMKKKEIEEAKAKAATAPEAQGDATTKQESPNDQSADTQESIYQVPKSNEPVNPQEQNLLDLEDQVDTILKGIEQIKNLDFDELTSDEAPRQPTSPTITTSPTTPNMPVGNDPWGVPSASAAATSVAAPASSSLSNLQQLSAPPPVVSSPFGGMQAFPGTPAPSVGITAPGFGMVQPGAVPFGVPGQQQAQMMGGVPYGAVYGQQPAAFGTPFGAAGNLRSPIPGQPFPPNVAVPGAVGMQPGFAGVSPAFNPFSMASPAAAGVGGGVQMVPPPRAQVPDPFQTPPENMLQPMKPAGKDEQGKQAAPRSPTREMLFGDLVDIKKSPDAATATKSPKEMFRELHQQPKKSLNQIKGGSSAAASQQPPKSPS